MSKLNRVMQITIFIGLIMVIMFTFMKRIEAQQQAGFLHPPYFGVSSINVVFDHEYPVYSAEIQRNNEADDDFIITTTVRHNDGQRYQDDGVFPGYSGHDGIDYNLRYQYVLASHAGTA